MSVIKNKFLIFFFLIISSLEANELKSQELDLLFEKLSKIEDPYLANLVEQKIWEIWSIHPKDEKLTDKLKLGKELMNEGNYSYALQVFTNITKSDPTWSEGWNARATLLYYMKDFKKSLNDIDKVLSLEPRHFGALSGRAQISIKLEEYEKAISDLKKVKKLNPASRSNQLIEKLKELLKGQSI
jgi:tetratricopeptide (TPR) repeat protein